MKAKRNLLKGIWLLFAALLCVILATPPALGATKEDGQKLFQAKCASCHSIGGGDLAGPDLAGISDKRDEAFLKKVIKDPQGLIDSGDPVMKELLKKFPMKMPALGLSDDQVSSLLLYMGSKPAGPAPGTQLPPGSAVRGRSLFIGESRFSAGGPACIICHSAGAAGASGTGLLGGGVLAKDLTHVYGNFKEAGTAAALMSLQFPAMKDLFADRPLTDQEIADMTAFLKETDRNQAQSRPATMIIFVLMAAAATAVMLILSELVWGKRIRGVRRQLVGGSR